MAGAAGEPSGDDAVNFAYLGHINVPDAEGFECRWLACRSGALDPPDREGIRTSNARIDGMAPFRTLSGLPFPSRIPTLQHGSLTDYCTLRTKGPAATPKPSTTM